MKASKLAVKIIESIAIKGDYEIYPATKLSGLFANSGDGPVVGLVQFGIYKFLYIKNYIFNLSSSEDGLPFDTHCIYPLYNNLNLFEYSAGSKLYQ